MNSSFKHAGLAALMLAVALAVAGCASAPTQPPELAQRIESAQTRAEHEALAEHFAREAAKSKNLAEQHRKMARAYQGRSDRGAGSMVAHCNSLVRSFDAAAADLEQMAAAHRQMAAQARP
jgi:hypothetical protein